MYKLTFIHFILPFFSWFNSYEVLIKICIIYNELAFHIDIVS